MTFPAISSLASGHFRLPSAVFPFRAASEILKLPKFRFSSSNVSLLLAANVFGLLLRVIIRKKNDFTSQKRTWAIIVLCSPPSQLQWPRWSAVSVKIRSFYDNFKEFLTTQSYIDYIYMPCRIFVYLSWARTSSFIKAGIYFRHFCRITT